MSAPDPKEAWQRIQTELTRRTQRLGGGGGPPKGTLGGAGAFLVILGGAYLANNALFNGPSLPRKLLQLGCGVLPCACDEC